MLSNGSEAMDWILANCHQCKKYDPDARCIQIEPREAL